MALLRVYTSYVHEVWYLMEKFFDTIEVVDNGNINDKLNGITTFRVLNDEVPADDVLIDVTAIELVKGVEPIVISYELQA